MGAVTLELDEDQLASLTTVSAPQAEDYPYGEPGVAQRHRKIAGGR
jgi:aryl-alcohol dehydrogenase (NADP+)